MAASTAAGAGHDVGMVQPPGEADGIFVTHVTRCRRRNVIGRFRGDTRGDAMARGAGPCLYANMVEDAAR